MKILSIGQVLQYDGLDITSAEAAFSVTEHDISHYAYIVISGGDGTIRRVIKALHGLDHIPTLILNPSGSFNVIAKIHKVPGITTVLKNLMQGKTPKTQKQTYYSLNKEVFLFSAGNMGDLQHIFLSETLRFGILKKGMSKYILALLFLLPLHLIITPFMLLSTNRFFIFTPVPWIKKIGSFYGEVKEMTLELEDSYNHLELDGDIVTMEARILHIKPEGNVEIVVA